MAAWLYINGVPTYYAMVPYPFVPVVVYAGRNFYWTGTRYEATYAPVPVPVYTAPSEAKDLEKESNVTAKSIDWISILTKLEALALQNPAIAEAVKKIIEDILAGILTKRTQAPAKCDHGCKEEVLDTLQQQRCALVEALHGNLSMQEYIEYCCPEEEAV